MAKQSVLDMLNRPIARTEQKPDTGPDLGVMELVKLKSAKVEEEVRAEMQKRIDSAVAVQESLRAEVATLRSINAELSTSVTTLKATVETERGENGKLRAALENERNRGSVDLARHDSVMEAVTRLGDVTTAVVKANAEDLRKGMVDMINRPVQVKIPEQKAPVRKAPVVPEFEFKITSRDMNGDVLTLTATPRK